MKKAGVRFRSISGCFGCRLRGKKCSGSPSNQSCDTCRARHIECFLCPVPVPNQIRNSKNARQCRQEIVSLSDSDRNGIAELPITRAFFERFLHLVQSEDDDSDEQQMQYEVKESFPFPVQPSNASVQPFENVVGGMPPSTLVTAGSMSTTLGNILPDQSTNQEFWNSLPLLGPHPAPAPAQISALGLQQGDSNSFHDPTSASFGDGPSTAPNAPASIPQSMNQLVNIASLHSTSVAPVPVVIDLQAMAKSIGYILIPYSTITGTGT